MKPDEIVNGLTKFINGKLNDLSAQNPIINIFRPMIARGVNNNMGKLHEGLKLIQDANGDVDVDGILSEMVDNLIVAKTKEYPDFLSGVTIGEGNIKINIPFINKAIMFDTNDINDFKQSLAQMK